MLDRPFWVILLFFALLIGGLYSVKVHKHCGSPGEQNPTATAPAQGAPDVTETTCHWVVTWRWS